MTDPRLEAVYNLFKPIPETNVYGLNGEVSVHFEYAKETLNFRIVEDRLVCEVRPHDIGSDLEEP